MKKSFLIHFWNGKADALVHKLRKICRVISLSDGEEFFFDGTIVEWHEKWNDKYMFIPPTEKDDNAGRLCVTHHVTFGQY